MRLWDACQTPDFRKTTQEEHARLIGGLFEHLTAGGPARARGLDAGPVHALDRVDGDIDALSARLARVRTLAYVANRPDWLADPAGWQAPRARARGPALRHPAPDADAPVRRPAHQRACCGPGPGRGAVLGGIGADGAVTVEGHFVGRLSGVHFEPERGASALENRALRGAVERAVAPEIARRLGELAGEADEAFALAPDGVVRGAASGGRAHRRRPVFAARAAARRTRRGGGARAGGPAAGGLRRRRGEPPARRAQAAAARRWPTGGSRAWRAASPISWSNSSACSTAGVADEHIRALSRHERRALKSLGVRFGAFSLYLPALLDARGAGDRRHIRGTRGAGLAAGRRWPDRSAASRAAARGLEPARPSRRRRPGLAGPGAGAARRALPRRAQRAGRRRTDAGTRRPLSAGRWARPSASCARSALCACARRSGRSEPVASAFDGDEGAVARCRHAGRRDGAARKMPSSRVRCDGRVAGGPAAAPPRKGRRG